jgi:hypothetical protein
MAEAMKKVTTLNLFRWAWLGLAVCTMFGLMPLLGHTENGAEAAFWAFIAVMATGMVLVYPWRNRKMANDKLQVWKVTDCDWYAAATFDEAAKCARDDGVDEEYIFQHKGPLQPLPITEEELREMKLGDEDDGPDGDTISGWELLQRLRAAGTGATFFASTEW